MSILHAISSFYIPNHEERKKELQETLYKNLTCYNFKQIHLFVDSFEGLEFINYNYPEYLKNEKIKIIAVGKQPTYSNLFEYANKLEGELCMIMNSDIWLHSISDMRLLDNLENTVYGITRHESSMVPEMIERFHKQPDFIGSQDAFIFKSPVKPELIKKTKFPQNVWGSDNVLLREFSDLGYTLLNPASQIIIVHEHKSEFREDNRERLPPPWIRLNPTTIVIK